LGGATTYVGLRELNRRHHEEDERVQPLRAMLASWREVRDTRVLIKEARSIVDRARRRLSPRSRLGEFLSWAKAWAGRTDPYAALRREVAAGNAGPAWSDGRRIELTEVRHVIECRVQELARRRSQALTATGCLARSTRRRSGRSVRGRRL
jgi:hypothetical protein